MSLKHSEIRHEAPLGSSALLLRTYSLINEPNCASALSSAAPAGLSMEEVREYERTMQDKTNCKVKSSQNAGEAEGLSHSGVTQV